MTEAARSTEMLVSYHITTWHHNSEDHGSIFIAVETSNLATNARNIVGNQR
jgi:hypothetical protein